MHLFFDTETTGLHDNAEIAQFAAILCDENRKIVGQFKSLVKPDGWTMPEETAKFHGITQESCEKYGIAVQGIVTLFGRWCERAETLVAHNISYDLARLEHLRKRINFSIDLPRKSFCTMTEACSIMKLPPTPKMVEKGMGDMFKNPNLKEAHKYFTGEDFDGAHDALADVKATMRCYFHMLDLEENKAA